MMAWITLIKVLFCVVATTLATCSKFWQANRYRQMNPSSLT